MPQPLNRYTFSDFFADLLYVEELRPSWPKDVALDELIAKHFAALHGHNDESYWRYRKFMAVVKYGTFNLEKFNKADLAVVSSEDALSKRKLWEPIFNYAIEHDIENPNDFPPPEVFHP